MRALILHPMMIPNTIPQISVTINSPYSATSNVGSPRPEAELTSVHVAPLVFILILIVCAPAVGTLTSWLKLEFDLVPVTVVLVTVVPASS